jgi:ABC-type polysaccharide/polyol phosphate export permease
MGFQGVVPSPNTWLLLPIFLILLIMVTGVVLITSALNVFYRDVGHLVDLGVRVWLLLTPVAYARSAVPPQFQTLYNLNPLVSVFDFARAALLGNAPLYPATLWYPLGTAVVLLAVGAMVFRATEPYFAESV